MNFRKPVYILTAIVLAAGLVSAVVSCKQASNEGMADFLFVQYAESATLSEGVLTLKGVVPDTLYFSDRPHRIVGRVTTGKFVKSWDKGEGSFSEIPPNAVLAVMQKPVPLDLVAIPAKVKQAHCLLTSLAFHCWKISAILPESPCTVLIAV